MINIKNKLNTFTGFAICALFAVFAADLITTRPDPLTLWICGVLFLLFCVTLWRVSTLNKTTQSVFINPDYMDTRQTLPILIACAEYTIILHLLLAVGIRPRYPDLGFIEAFVTGLMTDIDVRGYQQLAEFWYVSDAEMPFFSAMIRAFALSGNFFATAVVINALCAVGAGFYLYRLVLLDYDLSTARRALKYMYIFPSAFFFAAPLAVNICLFFSVVFMYLVRKRYYWFAAIAGFCAALTDIAGTLLIVAAIAESVNEFRVQAKSSSPDPLIQRIACAVLPAAGVLSGLGCYLYINYINYENMFHFMSLRYTYFARGNATWTWTTWSFWDTAVYLSEQTKVWLAGTPEIAFAVSIPNLVCMFIILLLLAAGTSEINDRPALRPSYVIYGLCWFIAVFGVLGDLNAPRQTLTLFPLAIAAAALTRSKSADYCLTVIYITGFAAYYYFVL